MSSESSEIGSSSDASLDSAKSFFGNNNFRCCNPKVLIGPAKQSDNSLVILWSIDLVDLSDDALEIKHLQNLFILYVIISWSGYLVPQLRTRVSPYC
jgi:hypothetical protein